MVRTLAAALLALLAACGPKGSSGANAAGATTCTMPTDCPSGQGCVNGLCQSLACGGCDADQVCGPSGACIAAEGAACPTAGCPTGFACTPAQFCSRSCTLDGDCRGVGGGAAVYCNGDLGHCAECRFDADCPGGAKKVCDAGTGKCVGCTSGKDCGAGNYCEPGSKVCKPGCLETADCAPSLRCVGATASAPGRCVQCTAATEGTDCPGQRCDAAAGACVDCLTNHDCPGQPGQDIHCAPMHKCVQCLVDADCPAHETLVCDAAANKCVRGCRTDAQCPLPTNTTFCDPAAAPGYPLGNCYQCVKDSDCDNPPGSGHPPETSSHLTSGSICNTVAHACKQGACSTDARCAAPGDAAPLPRCSTYSAFPLYHQCVECLSDADCARNTTDYRIICDASPRNGQPPNWTCRQYLPGQTCQHSYQCGDPSGIYNPGCSGGTSFCVQNVECPDNFPSNPHVWTPPATTCAIACNGPLGEQGCCPNGFLCQSITDTENGTHNFMCVLNPGNQCVR